MFRIRLILFFIFIGSVPLVSQDNVSVSVDAVSRTASMSNGIISISINSKGQVNSLFYNDKDLIDASNGGRFYFSYNDQDSYKELSPNSVRIEKQTGDYAEVVYSNSTGTLNIEQAYIMLKGISGIYCYIILKGTSTAIKLREMRVVYRVSPSLFTYGYVTDEMQGWLPSVETMKEVNDLAIMDATYPLPDGSIYTKYDWANYIVADSVHGIMSENEGVWAIAPSNEFMNGGPMKQELTVHTTNKTPLVLQMLQGEHFGAAAQVYIEGDEKIYGPFFIYVNSGDSHHAMIENAKNQASAQISLWPFQWLENELYPLQRTKVKGKIYLPYGLSPDKTQVVLAQPDIDIYDQGKDYLFWSKTDDDGSFTINHVRPGSYTLYAYATAGEVTGIYSTEINVSDSETDLGNINRAPVKYEHMLWQIGESDRLTKGFNISDSLRAYGLYDLPPASLTYTIGTSSPQTDWYYAQTKTGTWTVLFNCDMSYTGNAALTVSIAGASSNPNVEVYINDNKKTTWSFGNDGAVYRSAVSGGRHQVKTLSFPASDLLIGQNTVKFKMISVGSRGGLMYDFIKLEAGNSLTPVFTNILNLISKITVECYPNPFTHKTVFKINSNMANEKINLSVYNIQGQLIDVVFDGYLDQGINEISWENAVIPVGLYIYRLKTKYAIYSEKVRKTCY
ncbi:MAG: T9SS type A sorting domain-containing protein [Bacteroidales bacterium]|nr:T9SS type A sorting domain-containing protein [Bacteroidales bacterium]